MPGRGPRLIAAQRPWLTQPPSTQGVPRIFAGQDPSTVLCFACLIAHPQVPPLAVDAQPSSPIDPLLMNPWLGASRVPFYPCLEGGHGGCSGWLVRI